MNPTQTARSNDEIATAIRAVTALFDPRDVYARLMADSMSSPIGMAGRRLAERAHPGALECAADDPRRIAWDDVCQAGMRAAAREILDRCAGPTLDIDRWHAAWSAAEALVG